ncbi:hypothetical protein ID866_6510 [Astraeus odoratus]|nr:hypothetical protein ID866_6510 [Astraeus odoratus]
MCPFTSLLAFFLLSLSIANASSARSGMAETALGRIPDPKRASLALYGNQLGKRDGTVYVEKYGNYYLADVVTSSGSTCKVVVDTGSSYTWIGARENNPYVRGPDSREIPQIVNINYGDGTIQLRAATWFDRIVLDGLTLDLEIGTATELIGFQADVDGILGLGPTRLNDGITSDSRIIPTVVDDLYSQGTISVPVLGVYLVPTNVRNVGGSGLLSFGDIDVTVLTSDVKYVSVTQTSPASDYWGFDASFEYGNLPILGPTSGILDTGAVRISLTNGAFMAYKWATGAVINPRDVNQQLTITQDQYDILQILTILINGQSYSLSPNAQISARFKLGTTFFQRYYVVFDSGTSQIGFASHLHTYSETN